MRHLFTGYMISVLSSTLLFSRQFLCNFPPSSTGTSTKFTRHFFAVYNVSVLFITPHFSRLFLYQDLRALFFRNFPPSPPDAGLQVIWFLYCPPLFTFPGSFSVKIFRHPLCVFHQVHLALVCRLYDFCIVLRSSLFPGNFCVKIPRHPLCNFPPSSPGTCLQVIWFLYCSQLFTFPGNLFAISHSVQ